MIIYSFFLLVCLQNLVQNGETYMRPVIWAPGHDWMHETPLGNQQIDLGIQLLWGWLAEKFTNDIR